MKLVARFKMKKETKGAVMFEEIDEKGEPAINISGSIYLRKSALGGVPPMLIPLTQVPLDVVSEAERA
jgi:hypothetical protein